MSFPVLPSPSILLAVALVINRSHSDGPSFVFHYPTKATPFDDTPDPPPPDDLIIQRLSQPEEAALSAISGKRPWPVENDGADEMEWGTFAGFPTRDLASILTPKRSYNKRMFHLSLDEIHCVSRPTHVPECGFWQKRRRVKKKREERKGKEEGNLAKHEDGLSPKTKVEGLAEENKEKMPEEGERDMVEEIDEKTDEKTGDEEGQRSEQEEEEVNEENEDDNTEATRRGSQGKRCEEGDRESERLASMTMFNLVFFLAPKKHETNELVDTIYNRILKKMTKTLYYTQVQSDFIWQESRRILALKDKGREQKLSTHALWSEILSISSLASSIRELYIAISTNRIATLQLSTTAGTFTPSVQIPFPYAISVLPPEHATEQQGIWLTTANSTTSDDIATDPDVMDRSFGMLLLASDKKIIAELEAAEQDGTTKAMIEFVKLAAQPNVTFHQMARTKHLSIHQVREFARHFIFWRRGIAIPPLFSRDTYIASPNLCPTRLPRASVEWQREFPLAPPLVSILSDISAAPRPWKSVCPHKSQRPEYMKMLAWLMRGSWVTQLCTFSYVVVWPEIIYEVQYNQEAAELKAEWDREREASERGSVEHSEDSEDDLQKPPSHHSHFSTSSPVSTTPSIAPPSSTNSVPVSATPSAPSGSGPVSPTFAARPQIGRKIPGAAAALLASRTSMSASPALPRSNNSVHTMPIGAPPGTAYTPDLAENARRVRVIAAQRREAHEKATAHARKTVPQATRYPSMNEAGHLFEIGPHIILDARRATGLEALYLDAIKRRFESEQTKEVWQRFAKYFNGRCALERIPLLEDMRKRDVMAEIEKMSEHLLCVRHW